MSKPAAFLIPDVEDGESCLEIDVAGEQPTFKIHCGGETLVVVLSEVYLFRIIQHMAKVLGDEAERL